MTDPSLRLSRNVAALGVVSLAMGASSAMIHGLLPVYLVTILGASALVLGAIEGIAEGSTSIVKIFSGALSDQMRRRKPLVLIGYGLSACAKLLFPIADTAATILFARFADRIGKGVRDAPRDAFLADVTPRSIRGSGFGLRQALYTIGAVLGPLAAMALMEVFDGDFLAVFWMAVLPALVSMAVLAIYVDEPPVDATKPLLRSLRREDILNLPPQFWWAASLATVLALARFSPAFLVLKTHSIGISAALLPLAWILMNAVYGAAAYPFGTLSDHVNPRVQLAFGFLCLVGADLALAFAESVELLAVGIILWGLQMGIIQGLLSAMVANAAPDHLRGTAFGVYELAVGVATFLASAGAGALWALGGPIVSFLAAASLAILGAAMLLRSERPSAPMRPASEPS